MYLKDIINTLQKNIPRYSDKFSEKVAISTISYSGGTVTVVTSSAHGLTSGDIVTIVDSKEKIPISSITEADGVATVTTTLDHDLTLDYLDPEDQPQVTIDECSITNYNDNWDIQSVDTRTQFTFNITGSPADANDGYVLINSEGGYSGQKQVTVVDITTFTFTTSKTLATTGSSGYVHYGIRIAGAVTIDRAVEAYSRQSSDNLWLFVISGDAVASKDRNSISDATTITTIANYYKQRLLTNFSIIFILPSQNDISGRESYDTVIEESAGLFKSIINAKFDSPYTIASFSRAILEGHNFFGFFKAYYVHQFNFSVSEDIVYQDTLEDTGDVAFRDIEYDILNTEEETLTNNELKLDQ